MDAMTLSIVIALFIFTLVLFIGCISYKSSNNKDWLFSDFNNNIYQMFFNNKDPKDVAKLVGIELDKYAKNCMILKVDTRLIDVIAFRIYGIAIILLGLIFSFAINIYIMPIFLIISLLFISGPIEKIDKEVKTRKMTIESELSDFLDLLEPALEIKMPIEQAIISTAKYKDGILSEELLYAIAEANLGIEGWQTALENMALKYDVEVLSDFVREVVTAYDKGTDIFETVARTNKEIKKTHLLTIKERASKTTSTILIPVFVCKILPILALLLIPVMIQMESGF